MEQTIIAGVLIAGVAILLFFKLRQVARENRERRAERAFVESLVSVMQSKDPQKISECLMGTRLWVPVNLTELGKIMSFEAHLPAPGESPVSEKPLDLSPRIMCFATSEDLGLFRASLPGRIFESVWKYEALTGRLIFEEALSRSVPVVLKFGGDQFNWLFEVDEVRAVLNAAA